MRDLVELVDGVDLVTARADGLVDPQLLAAVREDVAALRERRGFFGDTVVMALAGGTGSGKSSLLNAIAGSEIASVSHLRPHTHRPLAWLPVDAEPAVRALVDELDADAVEQDRLPGVVLVDLPDMDSIEAWHRATVEDLLPRFDAVVWLMDPEKYRDSVLHVDFLAPLSPYAEQFLFVMNQVDRLPDGERDAVETDLRESLAEDGYDDPLLFLVAANPRSGEPAGLQPLLAHLAGRVDAKRLATAKLLGDAEQLLRRLGEGAGVWRGASLGFVPRWRDTRSHVLEDLTRGGGRPAIEDAMCHLEDLVTAVALEAGDQVGADIRAGFDSDRLSRLVSELARPNGMEPAGRRRRRQRETAERALGQIEATLDAEIGEPLAEHLWRRARLAASIAYVYVGARQLRELLLVRSS